MEVLRSSSVLLLALLASGCILAEPVEHNPRQTAPILNVLLADPPVTQLLRIDVQDRRDFLIPVVSEDVGEELWFAVHRNYGLATERWENSTGLHRLPPSNLTDTSRNVEFSWSPPLGTEACLQLTVVVCHERNFDLDGTYLCDKDASDDTAIATWWVNVGDVSADPTLGPTCPGPAPTQ